MISNSNTKSTQRDRIKLFLIKNPQINPYRFSFENLYRQFTGKFRVLPNFIIIGAGRAGTTALYSYLIQHPDIFPAYTEKNDPVGDLHFFEYMISNNVDWYKSHFPTHFTRSYHERKNSFITGEFTSTYMYHPDVPKRVFNLLPKIKLIVILRNPIDKAYSTYQQQFQFEEYTTSFEDTIDAELRRMKLCKDVPSLNSANPDFESSVAHNIIRHGIYADYLETWLEIFDRKQILILNSEDLKNSTKETLHSVFDFLNVSEHYIGNTSQVNVGKYPPINKITRKKLIEFFKPHNQRLNKLLDTEFDWDR